MRWPTPLDWQNLAATLTYPWFRAGRALSGPAEAAAPAARWVIGGHSGRLYADNAAAVHRELSAQGRDVTWISASPSLTEELTTQGAQVLSRNTWAARRAIEQADVLAYSHGPTDLDHLLVRRAPLRGLRVHLNHCMSHIKAWGTVETSGESDARGRALPSDPFDYMLASSERERANLQSSFPGAGARVVLGGGAHLDVFLRARSAAPGRTIVYFPTFRDAPEASRALDAQAEALASHPRLRAFLADSDRELCIVGHVNHRGAAGGTNARVRFASAEALELELLGSCALISDYSGVICDYLALGRPLALFPFDAASYLRGRRLYVPYESLDFAPMLHDTESLVGHVVSGALFDPEPYRAARARWERTLFPTLEPGYARRTVATIDALIAGAGVEHAAPAERAQAG